MENKLSFWCFIVLAIIGGFLGLQEFYRKKTICGIFAVVFFWTGIPALVALIEAIVWLFRGEYLFNLKYNNIEQ